MNYAEMSDFEINKLVTSKYLLTDGWKYNEKENGFIYEQNGYFHPVNNYCGLWEKAGNIIYEKGICLTSPIKPREKWTASWFIEGGNWSVNDFTVSDKNPLRAAMIVFLMMNEDK